MSVAVATEFRWEEALEGLVVEKLLTTFGLDFVLFQDQLGGNVNTISNVRQGIYATEAAKQQYDSRGEYDSTAYHSGAEYIERGRADKELQNSDRLQDRYTGKALGPNDKRDLDHVISAKEIHDDAGRVLAKKDGVILANVKTNLASTHASINRSKKDKPLEKFLDGLPAAIQQQEQDLSQQRARLADMPRETPQQRHEAQELQDKIRKGEQKLNTLKSVDPQAAREADAKARGANNLVIYTAYYTSPEFLSATGSDAALSGGKMGMRQAIGLALAEVWFELRAQLPRLLELVRQNFQLSAFLDLVQATLKGIWERIHKRIGAIVDAFIDGGISGVLSSITTTLLNIFLATQKVLIKLIRETWGSLVKAFKLIAFNPDQLHTVDLIKAVTTILVASVGTVIGVVVHGQLSLLSGVPFGEDLATFLSALVTGIVTLGLQYLIHHDPTMQKFWEKLREMLDGAAHALTLEKFREANRALDQYIAELSRIEFNLDLQELERLTNDLSVYSDEMELNFKLRRQIGDRGIDLPYDPGSSESLRAFLLSKVKP